MKHIASATNEELKHIRKLLKDKAYRYEQKQFVAEGFLSIEQLGCAVTGLYCTKGTELPKNFSGTVITVEPELLNAISEVENSQGLIGVCSLNLKDKTFVANAGRYVFLDRIQDPGNLGTIIRTALAFGINGVILNKGCVDPFSPKVVRSTMGALTAISIISSEFSDLSHLNTIAADNSGTNIRTITEKPKDFVLCVGNEAQGLAPEIIQACKKTLAIPQTAEIDSLNAAIATGILLFALTN
ncbi:MAG: hypothetical protein A2252_03950 [Elusimicrobia bacterium RIFOXYA2_FULL_39_19]|nr:MAG: hypothetical protein A2252_03950 [Elusimicrobia bacterium RIFOXYA2_FULL_39_19]